MDSCRMCGAAESELIREFRDALEVQHVTVPVKHRETWMGRGLVVMFDHEGIWHMRRTSDARWRALGTGLESMKLRIAEEIEAMQRELQQDLVERYGKG